ncbi:MAG: phosphotransferase, partial [Thermoanaerobaculia bacterium]|nr:phosphotransferase [Thermoanaerobaculia bacterium]
LDRIDALERQLSSVPVSAVSTHGDFWPGNVFVDHESLTAIDFEGYHLATPSQDLCWFLAHADLYLVFRAPALLRLVRSSFLDGYGHQIDPRELELSRLTTLLKLWAKEDSHLGLVQRLVRRMHLRMELSR